MPPAGADPGFLKRGAKVYSEVGQQKEISLSPVFIIIIWTETTFLVAPHNSVAIFF